MLILDRTPDAKLATKMWANAYETTDGFRYYRCETHGYDSRTCLAVPPDSCEQCWWIFYNKLIHFSPTEELRQKFLDAGTQAVSDAAQAERHGQFDYQPYSRPDIKITLDPNDKIV